MEPDLLGSIPSKSASRPDFALNTGLEDPLCDSDIQAWSVPISLAADFRYLCFAETVLLETRVPKQSSCLRKER
jgi:hypothetical protein